MYVAQRFSARVTNGNADLRESFQIKFMARYSDQTRKMLAPDIKPFPKKPDNLGQWVACIGQDAVIYQAPLTSDAEAREFASGGVSNPSNPLTSSYDPTRTNSDEMATTLEDQLVRGPTGPTQGQLAIEGEVLKKIDPRKLSDMVESLENFGITLPILQKASKNSDSGFPAAHGGNQFKGYTYDFYAVSVWARRRHSAIEAKKANR
jgi:hypothetical protein